MPVVKNIFLTGFMGCGKSSVGRLLSSRLGRQFVDLDEAVVLDAAASINEIFSSLGEPAFRELESQALTRISKLAAVVVSTGGGAVLAAQNRTLMRQSGSIVNLTAGVEAIASRLYGDRQRPLLKENASIERLRTMLEGREPYYADADLRIDTTEKTVEAVVAEILHSIKEFQ